MANEPNLVFLSRPAGSKWNNAVNAYAQNMKKWVKIEKIQKQTGAP